MGKGKVKPLTPKLARMEKLYGSDGKIKKINQHQSFLDKAMQNEGELEDAREVVEEDRKRLLGIHIRALKLRYGGLNYNQISEELGVAYITVRAWFKTGGKLYDAYMRYSNDQLEKVRTGAIDTLRRANDKAAKTLVNLLDSRSNFMKFRAAVEILNRTGTEHLSTPNSKDGEGTPTIIISRGSYDKRKLKGKLDKNTQRVEILGGINSDPAGITYKQLPTLNAKKIKR